MAVFVKARDSVVADEWVGQHKQLVAIGGVGQGLGIAHHSCLEHCSSQAQTFKKCIVLRVYGKLLNVKI